MLGRVYSSSLWLGILVATVVATSACTDSAPEQERVQLEGEIFGTFYQVTVVQDLEEDEVDRLQAGFMDELEAVDASMSTYRDDAELMKFNGSEPGEWQSLSNELINVLTISQTVAKASDGAFDVTIGDLVNLWSFGPEARPEEIPDEQELKSRLAEAGPDTLEVDSERGRARRLSDNFIDLSAVAKGYGVDRVATYLDEQGIDHYLVNIGGELTAKGYRDGNDAPWRIGVEVPDPEGGGDVAQHILPLHDISVATSGDYRQYFETDGKRYSHTLDPRDGRPVRHHLASVTVLHESSAWADAWATALMVLGPEDALALAQREDLAVLTLVGSEDDDEWESHVSQAFVDHMGIDHIEEMGLAPPDDDGSRN
ncbi:FAD:protein FMN transferase [Aidingimonas halophila]|uniref:FAD:protein FMN transferase n=1 Tax=Aidingimonas halophila TaxID=574349 RepID=A0A1H2XIE0_9GAMM|nr:FAD:protein FMN transferase [Aidingimonas halophila]GHC28804.1 FAD:protein FMN transferase [Aidingimonas halophila]SDW92663.1 thiamine biosynthesis lipoprotein [Aidingimonas halophila]